MLEGEIGDGKGAYVSEAGRSSSIVGFRGADAREEGLRLLGARRETERSNEDKGRPRCYSKSAFFLLSTSNFASSSLALFCSPIPCTRRTGSSCPSLVFFLDVIRPQQPILVHMGRATLLAYDFKTLKRRAAIQPHK